MKLRITLISIILAAGTALCVAGEPDSSTANPAFTQLKSLAGDWQAQSPWGGNARATYQIIAGGTAVVETFADDRLGAGNEMVTVYTADGDGVALTHYCMTGNQPHMKAKPLDPATGKLTFEFAGAANLAHTNAGHMRDVEFTFISSDRFRSAWHFYENGKLKNTEAMEYTRVR